MDTDRYKQASELLRGGRLKTWHPGGGEAYDAMALAQALVHCQMGAHPPGAPLDKDEALAALVLVAGLREWLEESEPRLTDAARNAEATWEELAGVLPGVADRRAAQKRRSRQRNVYTERD